MYCDSDATVITWSSFDQAYSDLPTISTLGRLTLKLEVGWRRPSLDVRMVDGSGSTHFRDVHAA